MKRPIRLNKYLAQAGVTSRRGADILIQAGHIKIRGNVVKKLGQTINEDRDTVEVFDENHGKWHVVKPVDETVMYALNKPKGYTCTTKGLKGRTIYDLVPKKPRVFSVGRLDKDSEGLILLTNNGDLANALTHPKKHVGKTYDVVVRYSPKMTRKTVFNKLHAFEAGVHLDGARTQPATLHNVQFRTSGTAIITLTIFEGKRRQLRRSFGRMDMEVVKITRIAIGSLRLSDLNLAPGKYKVLDEKILQNTILQ